jgi:hypothetical protein
VLFSRLVLTYRYAIVDPLRRTPTQTSPGREQAGGESLDTIILDQFREHQHQGGLMSRHQGGHTEVGQVRKDGPDCSDGECTFEGVNRPNWWLLDVLWFRWDVL